MEGRGYTKDLWKDRRVLSYQPYDVCITAGMAQW